MFPTGTAPVFSYDVKPAGDAQSDMKWSGTSIRTGILRPDGRLLESEMAHGPIAGTHAVTLKPMDPGRYILDVAIRVSSDITVAHNRIEFTVNPLPKSILVFCAHQDDDTAHPSIIRAAIENNIPIHIVYFTSGGGNGCERYYMRVCDPSRAMDFGEVRMGEARTSLGHLGVPSQDIFCSWDFRMADSAVSGTTISAPANRIFWL
jgi:GlcNAc-PI de-N-acetylase